MTTSCQCWYRQCRCCCCANSMDQWHIPCHRKLELLSSSWSRWCSEESLEHRVADTRQSLFHSTNSKFRSTSDSSSSSSRAQRTTQLHTLCFFTHRRRMCSEMRRYPVPNRRESYVTETCVPASSAVREPLTSGRHRMN